MWEKDVYSFPLCISPLVNVTVWLQLELAYYECAVQHFSHNATMPHPKFLSDNYAREVRSC